MGQDGLMKLTGHISSMKMNFPYQYFFLNTKIVATMIFFLKTQVKNKINPKILKFRILSQIWKRLKKKIQVIKNMVYYNYLFKVS